MQPARPHRHANGAGSTHPAWGNPSGVQRSRRAFRGYRSLLTTPPATHGKPLRGSNRGLTFHHTPRAFALNSSLAPCARTFILSRLMSGFRLFDLNPEQERAVRTTEGPLLILAGAGTGKTRVITARVAFLIAQGVDPAQILAVTFTNKAAKEMRERLAKPVTMSTFHALCVRVLRQDIDKLGYKRNFSIYDEGDTTRFILRDFREKRGDEKRPLPAAGPPASAWAGAHSLWHGVDVRSRSAETAPPLRSRCGNRKAAKPFAHTRYAGNHAGARAVGAAHCAADIYGQTGAGGRSHWDAGGKGSGFPPLRGSASGCGCGGGSEMA